VSDKQPTAAELVDLANEAPLFHDRDGVPYAIVPVGEHRETWPIRSSGFRSWLASKYYERTGKIPRAAAVVDALVMLEGVARFKGPEAPVYVRLAHQNHRLYVDLGDPEWGVVEVTPKDWHHLADSPVRFRRPKGLAALPVPVRGGRLELLRPYLNLAHHDDEWRLVVGYMVGAYSRGPYPVLVLGGEQGSAKTTTARLIRSTIDPATSQDRAAPRDDRDLIIAATNGHLVVYDNLSRLPDWLSDGLSRLATGAGFGTRQLYTDNEETLFYAARPIILNGITDLAVRSDLLDRAILVRLPRIPDEERKPERELWAAFEKDRPLILGALLDATSAALAGHSRIVMRRQPRMADFARWVVAAESALGWPAGAFLAAYGRNRASAHEVALDAASIVPPLLALVVDGWSGTASELLARLQDAAADSDDERRRIVRRPDWPDSPRALSDQLRRLEPDLREIGVELRFRKSTNGRRVIDIVRVEVGDSSATSATPPLAAQPAPDPSGAGGASGAGLPTDYASPNGRPDAQTVLDLEGPLCETCGRRMRAVVGSDPRAYVCPITHTPARAVTP